MAKKNKANTLASFLREQNPEELIYLGTDNGGSWLVIDTAENVLGMLDGLNRKMYQRYFDLRKKAVEKRENLPFRIVDERYLLKKATIEGDEEAITKLKKSIRRKETHFVNAYNLDVRYKKMLDEWVDFPERVIKENYVHKTDEPGVCILIEGLEPGKYWLKSEYDKAHKK